MKWQSTAERRVHEVVVNEVRKRCWEKSEVRSRWMKWEEAGSGSYRTNGSISWYEWSLELWPEAKWWCWPNNIDAQEVDNGPPKLTCIKITWMRQSTMVTYSEMPSWRLSPWDNGPSLMASCRVKSDGYACNARNTEHGMKAIIFLVEGWYSVTYLLFSVLLPNSSVPRVHAHKQHLFSHMIIVI